MIVDWFKKHIRAPGIFLDDDDDDDDDDDMTQFDYWVSSKRWKNNFLLIRDIRQCFIYLYFVTPVSIMI